MTTRRERIDQLSPEEYERALVRSAQLASDLAEGQGKTPSAEVTSILEKAAKNPGAIAKERALSAHVPAGETVREVVPEMQTHGGVIEVIATGSGKTRNFIVANDSDWTVAKVNVAVGGKRTRGRAVTSMGRKTVRRNADTGKIVNRSAASRSLRKNT